MQRRACGSLYLRHDSGESDGAAFFVGDDEEEFVPVDEELAERLIEMVENQLYDEDEDDEEE